jgi:hypothetical protein
VRPNWAYTRDTTVSGSATRSSYATSQNWAGSYRARAAVKAASPSAHRSSWVRPITGPVNTVDHPDDARAASEHIDATEITGSRWVTTISASGYTASSASSANRCEGFFSTQRRSASLDPIN